MSIMTKSAAKGMIVHLLLPVIPWLIGMLLICFLTHYLWIFATILVCCISCWLLFWYPADPIMKVAVNYNSSLMENAELELETSSKFIIVGAGFAGLAAGAALKRRGVPFDIFEESGDIGGQWYKGAYKNVHIISSKAVTEYKDFPMPHDYPDFPSKQQMWEYLNSYAKFWKLLAHIKLNSKVMEISSTDSDGTSYVIKAESTALEAGTDSLQQTLLYKGVIVCVGHHWIRRDVHSTYPGKFTGDVIHSQDYKVPSQLANRRVLVVGGGNSAMDILTEAARESTETHSSMRHGHWYLPRCIWGVPSLELLRPWMPMWLQRLILETYIRSSIGNSSKLKLPLPDHRWGDIHPTISSLFIEYVRLGIIQPHPAIKEYNGTNVRFVDDSVVAVDLIVYCTGYLVRFPLLEKSGLLTCGPDDLPQLVNGLLVPGKKNCYVFGVHQPRYGGGPLFTRGAELIGELILAQEKMPMAVSTWMTTLLPFCAHIMKRRSKQSPDFLVDPHSLCKEIQIFTTLAFLIPYLSFVFRWKQPSKCE